VDEKTELRLITQAKRGDRKAFEALMDSAYDRVFRLAYRVTGSPDTAEDVAQEVFLQVYRSLPRFRNDCRFSTWLHVITVRKAIDWRRQTKAERGTVHLGDWSDPPMNDNLEGTNPVQMTQDKELGELLEAAIMKLPPDQRAALALVVQEGHSYQDAAKVLDCSIGTVAWRVWNARRLLRDMLSEYTKL
jgi:RNA polymerase sigma-70 factor (ECF subfamily)